MSDITIVGAGAFGTALAVALGTAGRPVTLRARGAEQVESMIATRQNAARLPGATLPEPVTVAADTGAFPAEETVLLAVPMQALAGYLETCGPALDGRPLVACCKGLDLRRRRRASELMGAACPRAAVAVLTGPSFATDIAAGLPTALTLAARDADAGGTLQERLATPTLRLYRSTDPVGAELGGALKNVIAIACGIVMGAGLGESARAALITRGFAEMSRLAVALGARAETLAGLSGFGDLALTCTSLQSRNTRFGRALGAGEVFDPDITVEGAATARAVVALADEQEVDMPISRMVVAVQDGAATVAEAMDALLARPLGIE